MEAETGLAVLMGIFAGGIAGGSVPAILLNVPGTPASAATHAPGRRARPASCRRRRARRAGRSHSWSRRRR
ncbi:tripartite tricarboxylate transporter permease [Georgenia sp. SUBG003]|uniref:tripartite tricarboxylate transporter permease n=1 Tax=Georgenia sp. SUBG003 TaxID=1497974 RepID=UPI003AB15FA5